MDIEQSIPVCCKKPELRMSKHGSAVMQLWKVGCGCLVCRPKDMLLMPVPMVNQVVNDNYRLGQRTCCRWVVLAMGAPNSWSILSIARVSESNTTSVIKLFAMNKIRCELDLKRTMPAFVSSHCVALHIILRFCFMNSTRLKAIYYLIGNYKSI